MYKNILGIFSCFREKTYKRPGRRNGKLKLDIHLKKNQLDAQFIFRISRQTPLHVSGVSILHQQDVHRVDTTFDTCCSERRIV
jgi:hypothetical protein